MSLASIPSGLSLPGDDEAHVWIAFLSKARAGLSSLAGLLSDTEKQAAARFLQPDDRSRYIAAHGILRQLLGRYLSAAPAGLGFAANAHGKPALDRRAGMPPISFNLAHSGEVILCLVAINRRVGVDVEAIRDDFNIMELAQAQFAPEEVGILEAIRPPERTEAFFRCWTRKEAYVKARGEGLGFPLKQFAVAFKPDEPPGVRWAADDVSASGKWSMFDLGPAPGYAGAAVVEGRPVTLMARRWE